MSSASADAVPRHVSAPGRPIARVDLGPAAAWIEAAERALPAADDARPGRGAVAATRAYMATVVPDTAPDHAIAWAERALADLPPDDVAFRGIAGLSLRQAAFALGRLDRAEWAQAVARTTSWIPELSTLDF